MSSVFAQLERETRAEQVRDNLFMLARTGRWLGGCRQRGSCLKRPKGLMWMAG